MGDTVRASVENKRNRLINDLIALNVYKKDDRQLFELSLCELEIEYRRLQSKKETHPHSDFGSIRLTNKFSKNNRR